MVGLRERKKERTRDRILRVAARLFTRSTFEDTTMEDVAAAAEVSVGTLYNYFGSKTALLLAIVAEDVEAVARRGTPVVEDPGDDPVVAATRVIDVYLDVYLDLGRDLMREVVRASFGRSSDDLMPELLEIDERLMEQLRAILAHFQREGLIASDISIDEATALLFSTVVANLIVFISVESLTSEEVHAEEHRQVALAFRGLRPGDALETPSGEARAHPRRESIRDAGALDELEEQGGDDGQ